MRRLKFFLIALLLLPLTAFGADVTVIQGHGPKEFRRVVRTDEQGRLTGGIRVIDACEATTDWTALGNDTTGLATDLDHVLGAKSLEFDKVDGAANTIFGGIQKTISSVDLSFLVENGGAFGYSLNVSATTDIAYCFLRLGTDASNYNEWRVADAGLSTGWNSLRFNADTPSSAGALGNGWDAAVVKYLALGCAFDLETSTLADLRVDHVTAHVGLQVAADVNASVSSASGASQVDVQKLGGNAIDLGAGAALAGTQRITLSSDDPITTTVSEGPTATDATPDLVLASQDISKEDSWGIQISNSGGNPLTDADVQISRDFGSTWSSLTWTSCDTLAAGSVCDYDFPANSYTNVKVYTTSTAGTTVTLLLSSRR